MKAYLDILKPNELIYPNTIAYDWKQDKVDRPQGHPYYQWLQTNQGDGIINIENKDIILKKNDGILITPFTPHYYEPNQYWTTNFMTICGYGITFFPNLIGERRFFHIINSKKLSKLIEDFTDLFDQSLEDSEVSIKTYHIFLTIRDKIQQQNLINTSSTPIYWEIKKYIDRNYMYKLSIGAISKEFHISNQYLIKIFKQSMKLSPYQYLISKRIKEAKKLLVLNNDLLIVEVANLVGFENSSHFIETFKKFENCTPLEFRYIHYQSKDFKYD